MQTVSFLNITSPFFKAYCVAVHKCFDPTFKEGIQLLSEPYMQNVLHSIATNKSSSMQGFF